MNENVLLENVKTIENSSLPSIVLCFAAPIEGGKTTLSNAIAEKLQAPRVSFSEYLQRFAAEHRKPVTRETLQEIGNQLLHEDLRGFCFAVLKQQKWRSDAPLIVDGIRHAEVLEELRSIFTPAVVCLFFIKVDPQTQQKRLSEDELRHDLSLVDLEKHSTEQQVRKILPTKASLILDGTKPTEQSLQKIDDFLTAVAQGKEPTKDWDWINTRRIELAKKKNNVGLELVEIAEFDQLQTDYFDFLDAQFPRTRFAPDFLSGLSQRLTQTPDSPQG